MAYNFSWNYKTKVICETTPHPMEPVTRVEASTVNGVLSSITARHPVHGEDDCAVSLLRYDFSASPDTWREIITSLVPFLGMGFVETVTTQKQSGNAGRRSTAIPNDMQPLVEAIRISHSSGKAFHKTGRNGLYARRLELPYGFSDIGRDRLESLIAGLLETGRILQDGDGALTVPEIRS